MSTNLNELKKLLEVIQNETRPIDNHPDSGALNDCWLEVFEMIAEFEKEENFHPRAIKLIKKRKPFIVIANDEPYFIMAYDQIRANETLKGKWTKEDEKIYKHLIFGEPDIFPSIFQ